MSIHFRVALALSGLLLAASPALAGDISLDQTTFSTGAKGKVTFKNVQLIDANLSPSEAESLFSGTLSREEAGALLERLTAKQLKIPEVDILAENGDHYVLHDIVADHIEKGGAETLAFASIDGVLPDDSGDATLHSGLVRFQSISLPGLAASLRGEDLNLPAFRFAHLNWDGGEFSLVDKATAAGAPGGNRILLDAGPAHVDQTFDAEGAQLATDANFAGLTVKMPPQSRGGATLTAFGYGGEVSADAHFSGAYDPPAKDYKLTDYSLDLRNIGRIAVSGAFSGMASDVFTGDKATRQQALEAATVDWAQLEVTNAGLFDKIVAFVSLSQGRSPDQVKSEWRSLISQVAMLSGAQAVGATAKAVDHFIADPKTLTLRFKGKDEPLKLGELVNIADPSALASRLEVIPAPEAAHLAIPSKP